MRWRDTTAAFDAWVAYLSLTPITHPEIHSAVQPGVSRRPSGLAVSDGGSPWHQGAPTVTGDDGMWRETEGPAARQATGPAIRMLGLRRSVLRGPNPAQLPCAPAPADCHC